MSDLKKSERIILSAIWAAPGKSLRIHELNRFARLSQRGGRIVRGRMENDLLIARVDHIASAYTITFKGMQAIAALAQPEAGGER